MSDPEPTEVAIIGAGPTGLAAAVRLAQLGVAHVVLDASPAPTSVSKATLVHASTLELLAELGVADTLVAAGRVMRRIAMVDDGRVLVTVHLDRLPTRYAFALHVPQSETEKVLLRRHEELGGAVRRSRRVETVTSRGNGNLITGVAQGPAGCERFAIAARYVIGADGAHSIVRSAVGLRFPGETYAAQFVLADVPLTGGERPDDEATIDLSPRGVTVIGRLPSGNHRVVATVDDSTAVPEAPDRAFVDALLRERGIRSQCAADPAWSSRFRVHHRVADRFRVGGVFLAGDAAHVHSPAAGQGMNTGIADAYDLATRLAATPGGPSCDAELDAYEQARRPAALEVLRFTDRLTRMAMLRGPVTRSLRRAAMGTVGRLEPVQRRIATDVAGLRRSPLYTGLPAVPAAHAEEQPT